MHLLVLAEEFYPITSGGAHEQGRICELAVENDWEVTVITAREGGAPAAENINGIHIKRPFKTNPDSLPRYAPLSVLTRILTSFLLFGYSLSILRNRQIDVIYSASHLLHWVAALLATFYKLPHIAFVAYTPSLNFEKNSSLRSSFEMFIERLNFSYFMGDVVFCRNPEIQSQIRQVTSARVILVHGIIHEQKLRSVADRETLTDIRRKYKINNDSMLLVYAGRLSAEKRPDRLINIMNSLPDNYHLIVVGDGPERDNFCKVVAINDLESRITITGKRSHEETLQTIANADFLLLPSEVESYPTVAFEALALGRTVISTPVGILPHISHPRLYIRDITKFSDTLLDVQPAETSIDEEILEKYSMKVCANKILSVAEALSRR